LCNEYGINHRVLWDVDSHVISTVKEESRFADLLVISSKSFYENIGVDSQADYIANVTHKAECPVVLIPGDFESPENVILAYDGSGQSAFAIKQFCYLLPYYTDSTLLVVHFGAGDKPIPGRERIEELLTCHFKKFTLTQLDIKDKKAVEQWILLNQSPILIAGAYGRSMISEFFKESFISEIIKDHRIPAFITHT
jgi:hypothetical protein